MIFGNTDLRRRPCCTLAAAALGALLVCGGAAAQGLGGKPIRLVVGFAAGSGADITARIVSQPMSEALGQTVIVDNRPGGSGSVAVDLVAKSPRDGNTLLLLTASDTILPALRADAGYDLERDLAPISMLASGMFVLVVHPSLPVRDVKQLIAFARSRPGMLSYGTSGVGSSSHLAGELFNSMAKVKIVPVPYRSATLGAAATASGEIEMNYPSVAGGVPLINANKVRALAVTGPKRTALLPSIPTLDESGLRGYDRSTWYGLAAPAGTPPALVARYNVIVGKIVNMPEMKQVLVKQGIEPQSGAAEEFAARIRRELADNRALVKRAGATAK
jgi:tripartite-type tricarboxylate transporter receptor subunit TctC